MHHKPAFLLDFELPPGAFDVNVTPDKVHVVALVYANFTHVAIHMSRIVVIAHEFCVISVKSFLLMSAPFWKPW